MIRMVLGGERSGKSDTAWNLFSQAKPLGTVLAMGQARDQDFRDQILRHRQRRGPEATVIEPGLELPLALKNLRGQDVPALVDSLDFWLFACIESGRDLRAEFLDSLALWRGPKASELILVSGEVGLGPVAATAPVRLFVRRLGSLNQDVAGLADEVCLVVAGLSLKLKGGRHGLFPQA